MYAVSRLFLLLLPSPSYGSSSSVPYDLFLILISLHLFIDADMLKEEHQAIFNVANAAILKVNLQLSLYLCVCLPLSTS